jgi:hypothetical protein
MAKKILTHIDLAGNQILNGTFQKLSSDPSTGNFEGRIYYNTADGLLKVYHGSVWTYVGAVTDVQGTTNEVTVSVDASGVATVGLPDEIHANLVGNVTGKADTATKLATTRAIELSGDVTGTANFDGSSAINITTTVAANSVELGTDTTGNYVESVSGTANEIDVSGTGEGASVTLSLPSNMVTPNDLTVSGDLIVDGDITVSGTTTTVNTEQILLADNIITLNSNATGSATENAGIEVNRGSDPTVAIRYNETTDVWELSNDGSTYAAIGNSGDVSSLADRVSANEGDISTLQSDVLINASDIAANASDISALSGRVSTNESDISNLQSDKTDKFSTDVGNGANTSFAVSHNLGTKDVIVNIYDNASYDTVETDVVRTDTNTVTVSFTVAPSSNAYRVVVIG